MSSRRCRSTRHSTTRFSANHRRSRAGPKQALGTTACCTTDSLPGAKERSREALRENEPTGLDCAQFESAMTASVCGSKHCTVRVCVPLQSHITQQLACDERRHARAALLGAAAPRPCVPERRTASGLAHGLIVQRLHVSLRNKAFTLIQLPKQSTLVRRTLKAAPNAVGVPV